jgi:hypothetical protein
MGKKTLIPEEKWEGLRHAMEEAAGTRKTSKTPGLPPPAEGEAARPERGKKDKKKDKKGKKKKKGKKGKGKKKKKKGTG